jgi:chaperonin GroES
VLRPALTILFLQKRSFTKARQALINHFSIDNQTNSFMKPINDRVVIKPASAEETTKGGIIIPDTAKEKPQRGEVVAVGPGKDGNAMTVSKGDTVLYGKYAGQEINYEGVDYLIMREDDILIIL